MEFSAEEKVSIANLVKGGFPESMAEVCVAAKKAGYTKAEEHTASFVKVMAKGADQTKAQIETQRKALQDQLQKLETSGDRSLDASQRRISLKNAISRLK
jgi:hypothetical protein